MKQRVIEALASDADAEFVADGEVAGGQSPRVMHLTEEHRLCRSVQTAPLSHTPLKRPPGRIRKPAGVRLLQPPEQRDGFQSRFPFELPLHLGPDIREGVCSSAVLPSDFPLRRQPLVVTEFACGFLAHVSHPCRCGECLAQSEQSPQFADLSILDHRHLPVIQEA